MNYPKTVWAPSDKELSMEQQIVLSLSVSPTQEMAKRDILRILMVDKLVPMMEAETNLEGTLAIVPDLMSHMYLGLSHREMAESWMMESSLADLINRVNLKAPVSPTSNEVKEAHSEQSLASLLENLAMSL